MRQIDAVPMTNQESPSARPQRERRPPAWMCQGEYDLGAE